MIDYKLALALKEAGFPQKEEGLYITKENHLIKALAVHNKKDLIYVPTLSEFIEACGDRFGELTKNYADWSAGGGKMNGVDEIAWEFEAKGETSEEAVANLWLKLNESKRYNFKEKI